MLHFIAFFKPQSIHMFFLNEILEGYNRHKITLKEKRCFLWLSVGVLDNMMCVYVDIQIVFMFFLCLVLCLMM